MLTSEKLLSTKESGISPKPEGRGAESGMKICILLLLTLNAIFTGGIFFATATVAMQGLKMGASLQGSLEAVAAARPVIAGVPSFFNISTDTVLLPPSLPDFLSGMLSADFAPTASAFATTTSQLEKTMQEMGPFDSSLDYNGGAIFSSAATIFSAIHAFAVKFESWVPPPPPGVDNNSEPSWFEKLAFGEGFVAWLKKQGDTERIQNLSDVCTSTHKQLVDMQLGSTMFPTYDLDPNTRQLKISSYNFPIPVDSVNRVLADMKIVCDALKTSSTEQSHKLQTLDPKP